MGLPGSLAATLGARLDPASAAPLAVGFSGGGDSLALLVASLAWTRGCGRRVLALTVDHQLHPDSAAWTAAAGAEARALGADWRGLVWRGEKPNAGLPAAARLARHRLLAAAAREAGARVLLLGHTATDLAEAEAMRAETPQLGRLRSWGPSPVWPEGRGVFLFRPLLAFSRAELRAALTAAGRTWREDPANEDPRFARARARRRLGAAARAPADPLLDLWREGYWGEAGACGEVRLARANLRRATPSSARQVLAAALLCASGQQEPPRAAALARLLTRLTDDEPVSATLAGACVTAEADTALVIREARPRRGTREAELALRAESHGVFDGRFELFAQADLEVAPLAGRAARLSAQDRKALAALPAPLRPSLPCLILDEGKLALPQPWGEGSATARALAPDRWRAALGGVADERSASDPPLRSAEQQGLLES